MSAFLGDENVVGLRPVEDVDLTMLAAWRNSPELRVRTREFRPLSWLDQDKWLESQAGKSRRDLMFVVVANKRPVGVVGLCHWEPRDRTAEVSFYIGDESARGRGVAAAALRLLHGYGFDEVGLDRIWAECYAFNEPGIKLLKKLGYVEEGRLRNHVFRGGQRVDSVMLGLLREEWRP